MNSRIASFALVSFLGRIALSGEANWKPLFNGRDLSNWDKFLAAPSGEKQPLGLNNDPKSVFSVATIDGATAIHVSGEIYGALTTHEAFDNFHLRADFKWGEKRWPPRATVGRDSGILYCCVGTNGAGSGSWMRSIECNVMEKAVGQWWSVADAFIDVEGVRVTKEMEASVPYKMEGPGESIVLYKRGAPLMQATPADGITPPIDYEKPFGEWNHVEVIFWGGNCVHLLNGEVNMVLVNPRYKEDGREVGLRAGKIQLQSEAGEVFYWNVEIQPLDRLPEKFATLMPDWFGEKGFEPLLTDENAKAWAQCGPGNFELKNGVATARGGMGLWWMTNRVFTNFVMRGEFKQSSIKADSGVFVRFPNPGNDPWEAVKKGHEMEIGDPHPDNPTWRTGSFYPFQASAKANTRAPGEWNSYEILCEGQNYSARINGKLVTTWTDREARTSAGYVGLQNYNDGSVVEFRNVRIKALP